MRKRFLLFSILILALTSVHAQYKNTIWCFGDSTGINFNTTSPTTYSTGIDSRGGVVSIADSMGNLIFYAGGTPDALGANIQGAKAYNASHQLLLNSDSIVGRAWYREHAILPYPNSDSLFYLFSAGVTSVTGFFYSIIDMSQDSGRGAVVQKNIPLQNNNFYANDGVTAIKHGNGRDWWVIIRNWYNQIPNDVYYFYLISPTGINLHHTQNIGDMVIPGFFRIEPTNDGSKIATINNKGFTAVYDFDRCSGLFQNENILQHDVITMDADSFPWYWSCTFSPNKQLLYISQVPINFNNPVGYLYQYNLNDTNPLATRDTLYTATIPESTDWVKLAPDGKIYVAGVYENGIVFPYPYPDSIRNYINENLGVINSPDSLGAACNFTPYSFYLGGKRTYGCLPNNPNYELGRLIGSPCDTLSVGLAPPMGAGGLAELFVFYHSTWQKLFVNAQNIKGKNAVLQIFDVTGKEIFNSVSGISLPKFEGQGGAYFTMDINCTSFSKGMYIVSLTTNKEKLNKKFMKE